MLGKRSLAALLLLVSACAHQSNGGCPESCEEGVTRCAAFQQQVCVVTPGSCPTWSPPERCPPQQACETDRCAPCATPCDATEVRCSEDGRGVQGCAVLPSGCSGWGARVACGGAESCAEARCSFDARVPHTELVDQIPDYLQTDPAYGGFENGGLNHCAPVAVSNSLMWLDDNGFDGLVDNTADRKRDQHGLIATLASAQHMNTNPDNGTDPASVLSGVHSLLTVRGVTYKRLEFQGFRQVGEAFFTGEAVPDPAWVRRGFYDGAAVWLSLGFYAYDAASDTYQRTSGHWVTLVGFGSDGEQEDAAYLIVHDPAARGGTSLTSHYVRTERVAAGTLAGSYSGLPRSAAGYLQLGAGLPRPSSAEVAILDGVAVLVL